MPAKIGFVLKGYPRLSETFIAQEIHLLERRGLELEIFSMRIGRDKLVHPVHKFIQAKVTYIPEDAFLYPSVWWRTLKTFWDFPGGFLSALGHALNSSITHLKKSPIKRLFQACWLIQERKLALGGSIQHIHSHYVHVPCEMTFYISKITSLTYSISAHAKDIYTSTKEEIRERVTASQFLMTCTKYNYDWIRALVGKEQENKIHEVYHGVNLNSFTPGASDQGDFPAKRVLTVARLVDKKGYDDVFRALSILKSRGIDLHYDIFGGGDLKEELQKLATELGISVTFHGAAAQPTVLAAYQAGGVFVLGCRAVESGDRDGIPNSMAEAMSTELPVVATDVSGIPELLEHERTGLLVPQRDSAKMADALERLYREPGLAKKLAKAGREKVKQVFDADRCIDVCANLLLPFAETKQK